MAVCEMNFVSMIGPLKRIDELANMCGELGIFQPDNISSFYSNTDNFLPIIEENPFSSLLMKLKNSIYSCGGKFEKVDISKFQVSRSKMEKYIDYFSSKANGLIDKKREVYTKLAEYREEIEKLSHFLSLDKSLEDILSCEYIKARFGKIPLEDYRRFEEVSQEYEKKELDLLFFEFDVDKEFQWGIYFANIENLEEVDRIFSGLHFIEIEMEKCSKTPQWRVQELERLCKDASRDIEKIEKEISNFWASQKCECMKFYQKIERLSTYFEIKSYAAKYGGNFILVGWVPAENIENFKNKISSIEGLEFSVDKGSNLLANSPPVKLKNREIFKPFELMVNTYGTPCYNEMDPTVFVALTYPLLFGIMFADLGQGLLVALIGWVMYKLKNMEFGKILIPCGISSAVFGTLFGSVFGFEHALDPLYKGIFGLHEKPIEVMNASSINLIIYSSIGLGILLLIISMLLGIYASIKKGNLWEGIFSANGACGLIFYGAVICMVLNPTVIVGGIKSALYVSLLIILPLILIMFSEVIVKFVNRKSDWKPESWGEYITQGFFELFEVILSYLANTISFLRIGAFVLVHAGMMMVVFTIANMFGGFGYIIAVVIGNLLVTALEALLAGIQGLRLEFYEMFSRFFEGQGRPFSPVVYNKED